MCCLHTHPSPLESQQPHVRLPCLQTNVACKTVPMPIRELREYRVVDMAMGPTHTAVLVSSGRVFTFGRNMEGQLGTGHVTISSMVTKTQALQEKAMVRGWVSRDVTAAGGGLTERHSRWEGGRPS